MKNIMICITYFIIIHAAKSQNVGLGVNTPTRARLEVNGLVGNTTAIFGGDGAGIGLIGSWPEVGFNSYHNVSLRYIADGYAALQFLDPGNGVMGFDVHGSGLKDAVAQGPASRRALSILNNGRVMLGLVSGSNATLNVGLYAGMTSTAYFQGSTFNYSTSEHTIIKRVQGTSPIHFNYYAPNSKVTFGNGFGLVGVNWSIPVYALEIHAPDFDLGLMRVGSENNWLVAESQVYLKLFFREGTAGIPTVTQKGTFSYITGDYSAVSDQRFKQNIVNIEPMLDKLMQLRPTEYELIANNLNHHRSIGFIAQEVNELFPELVHIRSGEHSGYSNLSDLYMMNYSSLAPIVIKSLQEQKAMLNELETKLANIELKKQIPQ